ncbi:MAG: hypothetical protein K8J31_12405 [Anaerolineae bacterium]|nr:hypothetical protein [Anaerolineae bacterium]
MIACVFLPEFAITVARASEPSTSTQPLMLSAEKRKRPLVYAASVKARAVGVTPGMSLTRARALCPDAAILPVIYSRLQQAADDLLVRCSRFTDRLEISQDHSAMLWADLRNIPLPEAVKQAQALCDDLGNNTVYATAIGLAANKFTAQVAAVTADLGQIQSVTPGKEAAFLAPFPLSRLAVGPTLVYQFRILGLHTLGQFAALPNAAVNEHFGTVGQQLYERAHGNDPRPVAAYIARLVEGWTQSFEPGVEDRQILERALYTAAQTLAERLKRKNLASGQLNLLIHLDNRQTLELHHEPREDVMTVFSLSTELLRLLKDAVIAGPVVGLEVVLSDLHEPAPYQLDFFGKLFADQSSIDTVANRLQPRYRTSDFYTVKPQPHSSYIPEQCFILERAGGA